VNPKLYFQSVTIRLADYPGDGKEVFKRKIEDLANLQAKYLSMMREWEKEKRGVK